VILCCLCKTTYTNSLLRFYTNGALSYTLGQQPLSSKRLQGNDENIKIGLQYEYFIKKWKFYTDDRVILYRKHKNDSTKTGIDLDIKELYWQSYGLFDNRANFLIGRKQLEDYRSWWLDRPMDVVGIFNLHDLYTYQLYLGGRLNNRTLLSNTTSLTANLKHTVFAYLHLDYQYHYLNHLGLFLLKEKTTISNNNRNLNWIGPRIYGDIYTENDKKIKYWADLGYNSGDVNHKNMSDFAYDVGTIYMDNNYSLGISYANGGENYHQPIFADNKSEFLQKYLKFRYYGEFLDPKLSNMGILSLYAFYKQTPNKLYAFTYHNYRQNNPSSILYTTNYIVNPNGIKKDIGNEFDFIYRFLVPLRYNYKVIFSYFNGGSAFNSVATKKDGFYAKFDFTYYW